MIQTLDGAKLKRGDIGFVVGVTMQGVYSPCRVKAHSKNPDYSIPDEGKVYAKYSNCLAQCHTKNINRHGDNYDIPTNSLKS